MDNTKNDHYYLNKIKTDIRMIQISENAKKLSVEFRESAGELPWNELIGLRNRIVHDYGNVDLNIVFDTLKYDIPDLMERLSDSNEQ